MASTEQLERNLKLYPGFVMALDALFWTPVFILLFSSKFPISQVLLLECIYYIAVVSLELPTGYFSDKIGRRSTLLIAAALLGLSYLLFFIGDSFSMFVAAKILMATGFAFKSGTDASFHYDTHQALERTEEFGDAEARVSSLSFRASAAGALIGGLAGALSLSFPFALSAVAAFVAMALMSLCVEPTHSHDRSTKPFGEQFFQTLGEFEDYTLRWLLGVAVLSIVLVHVPYQVFQPYIKLLWSGESEAGAMSPIISGAHVFLVMLFGSWIAGQSMNIRRKLGLCKTFLLSTLLQNLIILVSALFLHPLGVLALAMRNGPKGLYMAPLSAAVNERIPTEHRATYLSLQSLAGRLAFGGLLLMLSLVVGKEFVDWPSLSRISEFSFYAGMSGWILLLLTAKFVRDKSETDPNP